MTVTIRVPSALRDCVGGKPELPVTATRVRDALTELEHSHPLLYVRVCDETGAVRRHVNLFVNRDHVRDRDGLETKLDEGDVLTIMPAVSGG